MSVAVVLSIVLGSMILHELAHGLVAFWLGDKTAKEEGRLTLNPIKHLDPFLSILLPVMLFLMGGPVFGGAKPVPINSQRLKGREWGMALVAVSGPIMNLILAYVGFLVGQGTGWWWGTDIRAMIIQSVVAINLGFFVFNLLPIPPLDGSRVLFALAPDGARRVMMKMEQGLGLVVVFGLVMLMGSGFSLMMGKITGEIIKFFYSTVGA